jgi:hypothetical protein
VLSEANGDNGAKTAKLTVLGNHRDWRPSGKALEAVAGGVTCLLGHGAVFGARTSIMHVLSAAETAATGTSIASRMPDPTAMYVWDNRWQSRDDF